MCLKYRPSLIGLYSVITKFQNIFGKSTNKEINGTTERGGSVATHEIRIREVPGSSPVTDQPG